MTDTPDDVQAAAEAWNSARRWLQGFHYPPKHVIRDIRLPPGQQTIFECPDTLPVDEWRAVLDMHYMREAIAASDRVRMERAGDVVERLTQNGVYLERSFPVLASVPGTEISRKGWESIQAGGRDMQIAAHLITTLRAALSEAQAERDAARVTALREAAGVCRTQPPSPDCKEDDDWDECVDQCAAAILALIPEPKDQADAG